MSILRILPRAGTTLKELSGERYHAVVASLGFEHRCREIPEALGDRDAAYAIPFGDLHEADFDDNKAWFDANGWEQPPVGDMEFADFVRDLLERVGEGAEGAGKVAVDVSSMSRLRIAAVVQSLLELPLHLRLEVDFLYTPAQFAEPEDDKDPPVYDVAPVSAYFAGWWSDLDVPLCALIGVGYEMELASSAIDALEPAKTEVYLPMGSDERYATAVEDANQGLMDMRGVFRSVPYDVSDPFGCFHRLESRLERLTPSHRIALIPLGPKIFAVCTLLAAAMHPETTQVIRVTAGTRQTVVNRRSDGTVYGLRAVVGPPLDPEEDDPQ